MIVNRARLRMKVKSTHKNDSDAWASIKEKREALTANIASFRRQQIRLMPFIVEIVEEEYAADQEGGGDGSADEDDEAEVAPERFPLMLPSWFKAQERSEYNIPQSFTDAEYSIREAHAETTLANLRLSIRTFGAWADEARDQLDAATDKTRARVALARMKAKQRAYVAAYREHLRALRGLGLSSADKTYRDLDTTMLRAHQPMDKPQALGSGKGAKDEAWFWRGELDVSSVLESDSSQTDLMTADGESLACSCVSLTQGRTTRAVFQAARASHALD